ncbi:hypothetical protein CAEBREN_14150 [Caenorhabditis brenneri]|uniref:Uncharacterized protein n=1 Tax=Caenorhabditis brenneri TaxID=135651 RepID=G0MX44_CAEBE|nr:hypothetical protein CAEBREN_14150 [Caenorhabditis brenneri]
MNYYYLLFSTVLLAFIPDNAESICISRRTDWGQFGSLFTDPLCDAWCRMRICGKGVCRETRTNKPNTASCICEKCFGMGDGDVIYPDNDRYEQSRQNYDGPSYSSPSSSSSSWGMNQRGQDNLYPSQNNYDYDRN